MHHKSDIWFKKFLFIAAFMNCWQKGKRGNLISENVLLKNDKCISHDFLFLTIHTLSENNLLNNRLGEAKFNYVFCSLQHTSWAIVQNLQCLKEISMFPLRLCKHTHTHSEGWHVNNYSQSQLGVSSTLRLDVQFHTQTVQRCSQSQTDVRTRKKQLFNICLLLVINRFLISTCI